MNNNEIQKQRYLKDLEHFKNGNILKFEYRGYRYYVKHLWWGIRYLCGYVDLNLTSKLEEDLLNNFSVHGGVTFDGHGDVVGLSDKVYVGFDCAHYGDWKYILSDFTILNQERAIYRDVNYVKQECKKLIDQYIKYKENANVQN